MRVLGSLAMVMLLFATVVGCRDSESPTRPTPRAGHPAGPLTVYVVNYPLQYFAERIGGEHVKVVFPTPADVDPAYWSPGGEIVAAYQQADLILLNGAGYAGWVSRASLPRATKVDTGAAFADRLIPLESAVTHAHGPQGAHGHGGFAFTTWLDPTLAIEQARAVTRAFEQARPAQAQTFRRSFDELAAELTDLDRRLAAVAEKLGTEPLLFSHPVYHYYVRRYDLNSRSLHWEPDEPPDIGELTRVLEDHPARWMVWEAELPNETVAALEAVGVSSVVFAPCGRAPEQGDLVSEMERNVARMEAGPGSALP